MVAAQPQPHFVTVEEYLTAERNADFKSEYLHGVIYAMAGSSPEHSAITANVTIALGSQLRGGDCQVYSNDLKVATGPNGLFAYPDLTIVCGEPRFHDERRDVLINPTLLVEVLSPSTEAYDRGRKFSQYQRITSLTSYLLIAQDEAHLDYYVRQNNNKWLLTAAEGLDASLALNSLNCALHLAEVYDRVRFAPHST